MKALIFISWFVVIIIILLFNHGIKNRVNLPMTKGEIVAGISMLIFLAALLLVLYAI